ncbi:MAG: zinc-binding dehydrogenase [Armatimonadota bacterium]
MKVVAITGERKAELVEAPDPQPKQDWVVVKVHAAPMCTEYKLFLSGRKMEGVGHEAAGEVVAVAQPGALKVGDRVVCMPLYSCGRCALCVSGDFIHCQQVPNFAEFTGSRHGSASMAQYTVKPPHLLPLIPEGVSYEMASLACCALGPTFGAMETMRVGPFETVLISGAGPVGLGGVVNAKFRGARAIVTELHPYRVERAKALGADMVLDPRREDVAKQIMDLTGGRGVDCAIECSGLVQAQRLCVDVTRRRGSVGFVGECQDDQLKITVSPDLIRKGLTLFGSWHYNRNVFPKVMQVIQRSPVIEQLISHIMPMSRIQEAMELCASHDSAKVILKPWE